MVLTSALLLIISTPWILVARAGIIRYDQSQSGDYNVHLDLKNIDVVALLDDATINVGSDVQYDYDYGELTLKPPAANQTQPNVNFSTSNSSSSNETLATSTGDQLVSSTGASTAGGDAQQPSTESPTVTTKPPRRCGAGFFRDNTGRCRRLRRPIKLGGLLHQNKNKPISG